MAGLVPLCRYHRSGDAGWWLQSGRISHLPGIRLVQAETWRGVPKGHGKSSVINNLFLVPSFVFPHFGVLFNLFWCSIISLYFFVVSIFVSSDHYFAPPGEGGHSPHDWLCTRVQKKKRRKGVFFSHTASSTFSLMLFKKGCFFLLHRTLGVSARASKSDILFSCLWGQGHKSVFAIIWKDITIS